MTGSAHITLHLRLPAWGTIISPAFLLRFVFYPSGCPSASSPSLNWLNTLPKNPCLQFSSTISILGLLQSTCHAQGWLSSYHPNRSFYVLLLRIHLLRVSRGSTGSWFSPLSRVYLSNLVHPAITFVLTVHIHLCPACPRTSAYPPQIINFLVSQFSSPSHRPSTGLFLKPHSAVFRRGSDFAAMFSATSSSPYLDSYLSEHFCK